MNNTPLLLICVLSLVILPCSVRSEFYEFVDENGVKTYTDSQGGIPESRTEDVQIHKEPYDDLPEEERQRLIEAEAVRLEEIKRMEAEEGEKYREEKRLRDMEKEEVGKKQAFEKTTTPVVITPDNQILVPVSLGYLGKTVPASLLLDTGANMTTIHDNIAERLDITGGRSGSLIVAGGDKIRIRHVLIDFITVGPKTVSGPRITILTYTGRKAPFDGLLGMDFLRQFTYTIDYEKSVIIWSEHD